MGILLCGLGMFPVGTLLAQDGKTEEVQLLPTPAAMDESLAKSSTITPCVDGLAAEFPCHNVQMLGRLTLAQLNVGSSPVPINDLWGWEDPDTGKSYALVARIDGVSFVDVSDPETPVLVGELPKTPGTPNRTWRDVKTDGYYAFVVSDNTGSHGMQVFDLRHLREFTGTPVSYLPDALYTSIGSAHNIFINEETDTAYILGSKQGAVTCNSGLHMVDISDPVQPVFAGCYSRSGTGRSGTGYTHDAQCVVYDGPHASYQGREVCFSSNETHLVITDVTDKVSPVTLGVASYPESGYVHQGWLTDDATHFVQDDELDEIGFGGGTRTYIWDVTDLTDPVLATVFRSEATSTDHNLYILDGFAYQANYQSGLRILDVRNPQEPRLVGWFDTLPTIDGPGFGGAWTAYPFLSNGTILLSSRGEGLFILEAEPGLATRFDDFHAEVDSDLNVHLFWSTSKQSFSLDRFVVERLEDGLNWVEIAAMPADVAGGARDYETFITPGPGLHRIRVRAADSVGGSAVTEEIVLPIVNGTHQLDPPYPNPASNEVTTTLLVAQTQDVRAALVDATGRELRILFDGQARHEEQTTLSFDVSSLAGGVYFIQVTGKTFSAVRRFVVAR